MQVTTPGGVILINRTQLAREAHQTITAQQAQVQDPIDHASDALSDNAGISTAARPTHQMTAIRNTDGTVLLKRMPAVPKPVKDPTPEQIDMAARYYEANPQALGAMLVEVGGQVYVDLAMPIERGKVFRPGETAARTSEATANVTSGTVRAAGCVGALGVGLVSGFCKGVYREVKPGLVAAGGAIERSLVEATARLEGTTEALQDATQRNMQFVAERNVRHELILLPATP